MTVDPHAPLVARVAVQQLEHGRGLALPEYKTPGAAGLDLLCAFPDGAPRTLRAQEHLLVPTGLVIALPPGLEAQVRPRSGLALRHGIFVLNAPGTIDADYRGEIQVLLARHGAPDDAPVSIARGDRIAQLVVAPIASVTWAPVADMTSAATTRGVGGFGSTGRN